MTATVFRFVLLAALAAPAAAQAARSDWTAADRSQLRVLIAGAEAGKLSGGIDLQLDPGWHTYWRNPGETGVPPVFDFTGSDNVAKVEVLYPAPERYDDGGSVSLVYQDEVVFPLVITPVEAARPVTLHVNARFGVCSEVCVPTAAKSAVMASADAAADPVAGAVLEPFTERLPKPSEPGRFEILSAVAAKDALEISVRSPDSSYLDLFADPPAGWFVGQPAFVSRDNGVSHYRLLLAGRPQGAAIAGQRFGFVAVAGGEAIEATVDIR